MERRGPNLVGALLVVGVVGAAVFALLYIGHKITEGVDTFFALNPQIGDAIIWIGIACLVLIMVAITAAVVLQSVGWGLRGMIIRSRTGVPVNVVSVLNTDALTAEAQAIAGELGHVMLPVNSPLQTAALPDARAVEGEVVPTIAVRALPSSGGTDSTPRVRSR